MSLLGEQVSASHRSTCREEGAGARIGLGQIAPHLLCWQTKGQRNQSRSQEAHLPWRQQDLVDHLGATIIFAQRNDLSTIGNDLEKRTSRRYALQRRDSVLSGNSSSIDLPTNTNQRSNHMTALTTHEQQEIDRANATGLQPVVFVHGLWLLSSSWDGWRALFAEQGYTTLAPGWP